MTGFWDGAAGLKNIRSSMIPIKLAQRNALDPIHDPRAHYYELLKITFMVLSLRFNILQDNLSVYSTNHEFVGISFFQVHPHDRTNLTVSLIEGNSPYMET